MKVGDLVIDKELDELAIVAELWGELLYLRSLVDGSIYTVPRSEAREELEVI